MLGCHPSCFPFPPFLRARRYFRFRSLHPPASSTHPPFSADLTDTIARSPPKSQSDFSFHGPLYVFPASHVLLSVATPDRHSRRNPPPHSYFCRPLLFDAFDPSLPFPSDGFPDLSPLILLKVKDFPYDFLLCPRTCCRTLARARRTVVCFYVSFADEIFRASAFYAAVDICGSFCCAVSRSRFLFCKRFLSAFPSFPAVFRSGSTMRFGRKLPFPLTPRSFSLYCADGLPATFPPLSLLAPDLFFPLRCVVVFL